MASTSCSPRCKPNGLHPAARTIARTEVLVAGSAPFIALVFYMNFSPDTQGNPVNPAAAGVAVIEGFYLHILKMRSLCPRPPCEGDTVFL